MVLLLWLFSSLSLIVLAQTSPPLLPPPAFFFESTTRGESLVVNVDLVNVIFTVMDRKGKFVTDLNQSQLKIFEDNAPQNITNFSQETDLPLSIGILIDTSSSIRDRFRFEQEAAIDFLSRTLRRGKDKAFFTSFDSAIELIQDYTDDAALLSQAIKQVRPGGGTKLYDALQLVCQEKLRQQTGRKIIILISDGDDNLSIQTLASVLETAQKSDVAIYAISTNSEGFTAQASPRNDKVLKKLAEDTGGRCFFPFKAEDLSISFQNIGPELRSQYSLAYRSSNPVRNGSFRTIRFEPEQRHLKVKARRGYYAPRS